MRPNRYLDDVEREHILLEIEREEIRDLALAVLWGTVILLAIVEIYLVLP